MPKRLCMEENLMLAREVVHDFNNLLAVILGHTSLARAKLAAENPALEHLDRAVAACVQAADLTRQMLAHRGSTFGIFLPLPSPEDLAQPPSNVAPATEAHKDTVLVVDDEPAVREVLAEAVETTGLHALTAEDGRQGLETFRIHQQAIALIVLDMQMPVMNGAETAKELWKLAPGLPLILTSGYFEQRLVDDLVRHPAAAFLPKPYTIDAFLTMVQGHLQLGSRGEASPRPWADRYKT
jgi:CheY-like chemotaxis protein